MKTYKMPVTKLPEVSRISFVESLKAAGFGQFTDCSDQYGQCYQYSGAYSQGALYVWALVTINRAASTRPNDQRGWTITSIRDYEKESTKGFWAAKQTRDYLARYTSGANQPKANATAGL
jgi:hypothetical protein